jgi:hypothetical protein
MIRWSECSIVFSLFWKSHCSPCISVMIQWYESSIVFSLFWKSHCSPCLHNPVIRMFHCLMNFFHCLENPSVVFMYFL